MKNLFATLNGYDPGMLSALAEVWGIASKSLQNDEIIARLQEAMLDPKAAEAVWERLDEPARTAVQLLVSSSRHRMKLGQFERLYGKIRKLGRAQINKEEPHKQPQSAAEALYYRGFIGEGFDKDDGDFIGFVYVPQDLTAALPLHKTSYEHLGDAAAFPEAELPAPKVVDNVQNAKPADTSIIDDMTTLLAFLQMAAADIEGMGFAAAAVAAIQPHLLHPGGARLDFLLGIGRSAGLIAAQDGKAHPRRRQARAWLNAARGEQIRQLAQAWLESKHYRDLWHIPGLDPDDSGWSYDPAPARNSVMTLFSDLAPPQDWVSVNSLIDMIKELEPDFHRPDGDYDSWYIRSETGEFLRGFESWDAVEGSLVKHYMLGPMHWLGLLDIGDDAVRLTAYGRAFLRIADWPRLAEPFYPIEIERGGRLLASRRVNRFDRFQLARFTDWVQKGDPYVYELHAASIQKAAAQGIHAGHIQAFMRRHLDGEPLPASIAKLLRNWQDGAKTSIAFETLTVLRASAEETLDRIYDIPAYRRFLGARLGPMACVIREDQWEALQAKLGEAGVAVDISGIQSNQDLPLKQPDSKEDLTNERK